MVGVLLSISSHSGRGSLTIGRITDPGRVNCIGGKVTMKGEPTFFPSVSTYRACVKPGGTFFGLVDRDSLSHVNAR